MKSAEPPPRVILLIVQKVVLYQNFEEPRKSDRGFFYFDLNRFQRALPFFQTINSILNLRLTCLNGDRALVFWLVFYEYDIVLYLDNFAEKLKTATGQIWLSRSHQEKINRAWFNSNQTRSFDSISLNKNFIIKKCL